jgi:hypothetical protein
MPILSNYDISLYPEVNIAYGSIVNSIERLVSAFRGIKMNWFYGIPNPITADIKGTLKVLLVMGILEFNILPFTIWHCGTVGDMNGYRTPFAKLGEFKL